MFACGGEQLVKKVVDFVRVRGAAIERAACGRQRLRATADVNRRPRGPHAPDRGHGHGRRRASRGSPDPRPRATRASAQPSREVVGRRGGPREGTARPWATAEAVREVRAHQIEAMAKIGGARAANPLPRLFLRVAASAGPSRDCTTLSEGLRARYTPDRDAGQAPGEQREVDLFPQVLGSVEPRPNAMSGGGPAALGKSLGPRRSLAGFGARSASKATDTAAHGFPPNFAARHALPATLTAPPAAPPPPRPRRQARRPPTPCRGSTAPGTWAGRRRRRRARRGRCPRATTGGAR